jgi:hypothetical protein
MAAIVFRDKVTVWWKESGDKQRTCCRKAGPYHLGLRCRTNLTNEPTRGEILNRTNLTTGPTKGEIFSRTNQQVVYGGTWIYIVGDTLGLMVVFKGLEV